VKGYKQGSASKEGEENVMRVFVGTIVGVIIAIVSVFGGLYVGTILNQPALIGPHLLDQFTALAVKFALATLFLFGALSGMIAGAISDAALELKQQLRQYLTESSAR
jgi:uncharacterized membrane protein YqgA involved in biofilm formation